MAKSQIAEESLKRSTGLDFTSIGCLLAGSGAAALIFQVLWIKQLSLVVGVDVYAITTGVSAFFGGLAIGSLVFGRRADQVKRPLMLYAGLELGVGVCGLGTTISLAHAGPLFVAITQYAGILAWALPFILLGIPAVMMGGTLPALVRSRELQRGEVARSGGILYAVNTAGGIVGALAVPFLLIPLLGVRGCALAAAGINLLLAGAAVILQRSTEADSSANEPRKVAGRGPDSRAALLLYTFAGAIALGYEVAWSQVVVQFTSTRTFSFAIVLATYLAGLVAGSMLYARWCHRVRSPWSFFGTLIAGAGLVALLEVAMLGDWLFHLQAQGEEMVRAATGSELSAMCARFLIAAIVIVFVPTVCLGAAFPAALRLIASSGRAGTDVGAVLGLNTAGGVVGTLLTGFILVPKLGIVHTLGALAIGAAVIGVLAEMREPNSRRVTRWLLPAMGAVAVLTAARMPADRMVRLLPEMRGGELRFYAEDPGGTVAVLEQGTTDASFRRLYVDGVSNSGDSMPSLRYMRLQALLPLIIHNGEPRSSLVIGFGTGITTGALLRFPGLQQRVCAELLKGVVRAGPLFQGNFDAASSAKVDIRLRDGRYELLADTERYDLITLEPPPPSAAGVVNLYSSDFYRLARSRLQPNGLFAQWWPLATQNDEDSRSLVRSFLEVFPHASLWTTELHEMLLVGSAEPVELDATMISSRFSQPQVASALGEVGIASPEALLATWITDRTGLERYVNGALPVTDDRPRIEYAHWLRKGEFARVLPRVLALQTEPPLQYADLAFRYAVAREHSHLLDFYVAALHAYRGERELWGQAIQRVLAEDGKNPYFRWIIGQ